MIQSGDNTSEDLQDTAEKQDLVSTEEVVQLLKNISSLIDDFDLDKASQILGEMEKMELQDVDRENVEKIHRMIQRLELTEAVEYIAQL